MTISSFEKIRVRWKSNPGQLGSDANVLTIVLQPFQFEMFMQSPTVAIEKHEIEEIDVKKIVKKVNRCRFKMTRLQSRGIKILTLFSVDHQTETSDRSNADICEIDRRRGTLKSGRNVLI